MTMLLALAVVYGLLIAVMVSFGRAAARPILRVLPTASRWLPSPEVSLEAGRRGSTVSAAQRAGDAAS